MKVNKLLFEAIRAMPEAYVHDDTALTFTYRRDDKNFVWGMATCVEDVPLIGITITNPRLPAMFYSLGDHLWHRCATEPQQLKLDDPPVGPYT